VRAPTRLATAFVFVLCATVATALAIAVAPRSDTGPVDAHAGPGTTEPAAAPSTTVTPAPSTSLPVTTSAAGSAPAALVPKPVALAPGPLAPIVSKIDTTDPVVFLTIDDGLVQDPAVVEYLRATGIPVTLFPTPPYVEQNPAYFESIHALGASVQNHTISHKNLTTLTPGEQQHEVCDVPPIFQARFGERPWLFRPPGGAVDSNVQYAVRSCGLRAIVLWRATMNDGRLDTQGGPLQPGDIVLLHFRNDLRTNLEVVVAAAKAQGLRPARLEDYLTPG
jgi:peptidoglycan/xylan/chitin deacetylase (PgdA/CDA1 family)